MSIPENSETMMPNLCDEETDVVIVLDPEEDATADQRVMVLSWEAVLWEV